MRIENEAFDARAEGGCRQVEVTPERVVIARRLNGVDMRVALAPSQYRGVALSVLVCEATDFLYLVRLAHADGDLDVTLGSFGDEAEARAHWRRWASALRLSRLIEREDGAFETDRAPAAAPIARRRGRATMSRRYRFLARRKMGRPALPCAVEG
jgi:hypothetical protein